MYVCMTEDEGWVKCNVEREGDLSIVAKNSNGVELYSVLYGTVAWEGWPDTQIWILVGWR